MSSRVRDLMLRAVGELRYEPTEKRVRAMIGDHVAADSTRAMLVWEPRRIVPSYAVPVADVRGELVPAADESPSDAALLHPGIPFGAHSTDGEAFSVRVGGQTRPGAAFRPADPELASYVILDFTAFDPWYEEDERIVGHPHDPFHRIDILRSSRNVRIELDGQVLAESSRPYLLFETSLPPRFYLPAEDMRVELRPSVKRTYCAYKGEASYWSLDVNGRSCDDVAWTYESPLREGAEIAGLVAFFDERVDVVLDGERRVRPQTVFSAAIVEEAGGASSPV